MPDEPMAQQSPLIAREQLHEVVLNFQRIGILRQTEASGNPGDVSIDDYSFVDVKGVAQDNIGRFTADSGKSGERIK
jgi:hypothetical protein